MTKWLPAGNKILVKCDPIPKTFNPGGRIEVPQGTVIERQEMKQMMGTVVAMGPLAYNDQHQVEHYMVSDENGYAVAKERYVSAPWVTVGDRVKFTQFAGYLHTEEDEPEVKYRVMHDLDIIMVYKLEQEDGNE